MEKKIIETTSEPKLSRCVLDLSERQKGVLLYISSSTKRRHRDGIVSV